MTKQRTKSFSLWKYLVCQDGVRKSFFKERRVRKSNLIPSMGYGVKEEFKNLG